MSFADPETAYPESDADDEYERSIGGLSPVGDMVTDSEASPIDSERSVSTVEHTPTTYGARDGQGYGTGADRLPETIVTDWTAEECADFIGGIGLPQYGERFEENEIVGEALVALHHDDLKSMGIASVGHRLTILKSVYDVKKAQDIPIESDHYQPLSADAEAQYATATLKDIKQLVEQLRLRDERMNLMEQDMRRVMEDYRKLREDVLPALRLAKDASHPLPNVSQGYGYESSTLSPPAPTPPPGSAGGAPGLKRQYSQRKILIGATPKSQSPTQTNPERSIAEQALDPSNAAERAVLSSTHLAAMNGSQHSNGPAGFPSPKLPSPSSPQAHMSMSTGTLGARSYRGDATSHSRPTTSDADTHPTYSRDKTLSSAGLPRRRETPGPETPGLPGSSTSGSGTGGGSSSGGGGSGSSASANSVEIFKSFRVSMDDPCHKVLPAALKKYQINAPWDQYSLYIVYGDQERCLGMDEKPLILFKQLDKEGKKPMFMLRKTNSTVGAGEGGGYDPPGGII